MKITPTQLKIATAIWGLILITWTFVGKAIAQEPSYICDKVEAGSIENMMCKDQELSSLDRKSDGLCGGV